MNKQNAQRHGSQFFAAFMLTILAGTLSAAVAPAGSFIGNQGSSTFTDSEGSLRTVTSNIAQVEVLQVFAATLETDQIRGIGRYSSLP
jgi:hypothetical protein